MDGGPTTEESISRVGLLGAELGDGGSRIGNARLLSSQGSVNTEAGSGKGYQGGRSIRLADGLMLMSMHSSTLINFQALKVIRVF